MDYVVGETLEAIARQRGGLPEPELRRLWISVLQSLAWVHERGYLHRDIKPSNIIVQADGRPLLIDFGAARHALGVETQMLTVMLSPGFAPFEQYNTSGSGPFTDLYSLGATIYYCLSNGEGRDASLTMTRAQAPDRVTALQRGEADPLPPAMPIGAGRYSTTLLETLDWTLQVWPSARPQTAGAVLARLEGPTTAHVPGRTQSAPVRAALRSRVWIGTAIAGVLLIALGVIGRASCGGSGER